MNLFSAVRKSQAQNAPAVVVLLNDNVQVPRTVPNEIPSSWAYFELNYKLTLRFPQDFELTKNSDCPYLD